MRKVADIVSCLKTDKPKPSTAQLAERQPKAGAVHTGRVRKLQYQSPFF